MHTLRAKALAILPDEVLRAGAIVDGNAGLLIGSGENRAGRAYRRSSLVGVRADRAEATVGAACLRLELAQWAVLAALDVDFAPVHAFVASGVDTVEVNKQIASSSRAG